MKICGLIKNVSGYISVGLIVGILCTRSVTYSFQKREADAIRSIEALDDGSIEQDAIIEYIYRKLEVVSELSVVETVYNNVISSVTKDDIFIIYTGTVRAGIDASLIKIDVIDDCVLIVLPESKILSMCVDGDSIRFYGKEIDIKVAMAIAEENLKKIDADDILSKAADQARYAVKGLLEGSVGGRDIVFMREG